MAREAEPRLSEAEPTQFGLDVELDSEPIQGSVYEDGHSLSRPFSGWLWLMSTLGAARGADPPPQQEPKGEVR
jgi:hypothetical protein